MTNFTRLLLEGVPDAFFVSCLHEGGGKGGAPAPAPVYTAPAAAPAPAAASATAQEATLDTADETEEEETKIKEAQKMGAKSLQIPLGDTFSTETTSSTKNAVVGKV